MKICTESSFQSWASRCVICPISGSESSASNATYRWSSSYSTLTTVRHSAGTPRLGWNWRKSLTRGAAAHSCSATTPSIRGAVSVLTAGIVNAGAGGCASPGAAHAASPTTAAAPRRRWCAQRIRRSTILQLPQRRGNRQARGLDGGQQPADQPHDERVDQPLHEERRRHREGERHLAEGLEVHRRGLIAVEHEIGPQSSDRAADCRERH